MNCNCKGDLEKGLAEHYARRNPKLTNVKAELDGYGIQISPDLRSMKLSAVLPVRYTAERQTKGGSLKAVKAKGTMAFSYCPFCGVKA